MTFIVCPSQIDLYCSCSIILIISEGKGSFFKTHKDSTRNEKIFGSLVITFPAPHEGGALVLRKNGKEIVFDSGALLQHAKEPPIAYIAFFDDVEYEVLPVTSGYRVRITYDLYFSEAPSLFRIPEKMPQILPPTE